MSKSKLATFFLLVLLINFGLLAVGWFGLEKGAESEEILAASVSPLKLYPNANGSAGEWTYKDCGGGYSCLRQDAGYAYVSLAKTLTALYNFENFDIAGEITSIGVCIDGSAGPIAPLLKTYDQVYEQGNKWFGGGWTIYCSTWKVNPKTGKPWQPEEVALAEAGFKNVYSTKDVRVRKIYLQVDFSEPAFRVFGNMDLFLNGPIPQEQHIAWPHQEIFKNKTLFLYRRAYEHNFDPYRPETAGKTVIDGFDKTRYFQVLPAEHPRPYNSNTITDIRPGNILASSKHGLLAFIYSHWADNLGLRFRTFLYRTNDLINWSYEEVPPSVLTNTEGKLPVAVIQAGRPVEMEDGSILVSFYNLYTPTRDTTLQGVADDWELVVAKWNGQSWMKMGNVSPQTLYPGDTSISYYEPLVAKKGSDLLMVIRVHKKITNPDGTAGIQYWFDLARSSDGGLNWQVETPTLPDGSRIDGNGGQILFDAQYDELFLGFRGYGGVSYVTSKDWGNSWSEVESIEKFISGDSACPSFKIISPSLIRVSWYTDSGAKIRTGLIKRGSLDQSSVPTLTPAPTNMLTPTLTPTPTPPGSCTQFGSSYKDQSWNETHTPQSINTNWWFGDNELVFSPSQQGKLDKIKLYVSWSGSSEMYAKVTDITRSINLTENKYLYLSNSSGGAWKEFNFSTEPVIKPGNQYIITFMKSASSGTVNVHRGSYWKWAFEEWLKPCVN